MHDTKIKKQLFLTQKITLKMKQISKFFAAFYLLFTIFACQKTSVTPENLTKNQPTQSQRVGIFENQVPAEDPTASIFLFFKYNAKKAQANSLALLTKELAPLKPVILTNDLNQTPIVLPGASFGVNQLYSSFGNFYFPVFKSKNKDLNRVYDQRFMVNFRSPEGTTPGDTNGKTVHVHFNNPVNYFGAWYSGNFDLSLTEKIQYVINNTVVAEVNIADGKLKFLGVKMPTAFTDMDIEPSRGLNQAYMFDRTSLR